MLEQIALETGMVPQALKNRPALKQDCRWLLTGFYVLSAARGSNDTPQAIQIQEILAYCTLGGIPKGEQGLKFLRLMQTLDEAWLNWWHSKHKAS